MGSPYRGLRVDLRENFPAEQGISAPRDSRGPGSHRLSCSAGHRQKLEDQTKAFPDRFGELERLRMRVTPSAPSPRGSLSTAGPFSSQAQTPIQGTAQGGGAAVGEGDGGLEAVSLFQTQSSSQGRRLHHPGVCYKGTRPALRACSARSWAQPFLHSFSKHLLSLTLCRRGAWPQG